MKTPGKHGRPRECRSAVRAAGRLCADPGPACFHRERLCPCGSQPCRSAGQRDSGRRGAFLIPGACSAYRRALWSSERERGGPPEAAGLSEAPVTEGATVTRLSPLRASRAHSRTRRRGAGTHAPSASGLARADCENAPGRTSLTSVHGHLVLRILGLGLRKWSEYYAGAQRSLESLVMGPSRHSTYKKLWFTH